MKFRVSLSTFVLAVMLLGYLGSLIPSNSKKEGFQSHAYASCVNGGFSKEFCLQNPSMPGQCQCRNGAMGTFQGRCVCDN